MPITFGFVERKKFPPATLDIEKFTKSDATLAAHVVSFMTSAMQVEMWMRNKTNGEVCLLVVEDNQRARQLISETQTTSQNEAALKKLYGGTIPEREAKFFPYRRIKQSPLFERKATSSVLQIADFCAYVFKRKLMGDERYERFFLPLYGQLAVKEFEMPSMRPS